MLDFLKELIKNEYFIITIRLLLVILLSGAIGLERELHGHPAGLRTHILVAVGSALVMLISLQFANDPYAELGKADPTRIASNIVTGVGFIGAGCIMHGHGDVKGITTAATMWVAAMIGMACGFGYYFGAVLTTVLVIVTLTLLRKFEGKITKKNYSITIITDSDQPILKNVLNVCYDYNLEIRKIDSTLVIYNQKDCMKVKLDFDRGTSKKDLDNVMASIRQEINPLNITVRNDLGGLNK